MRIEIAKSVMEHFHKMPFGFPTGPENDEYKLLEKPCEVTDEEGIVLAQLMPYGEHIDEIAKRLGRDKDELMPLLHGLVQKTWVAREGTKEDGYYRVIPWAPGTFELQVRHYSPDLLLFHQQHMTPESQGESLWGGPDTLPWFRVLPREEAIPYNVEVLPSEVLSHLVHHVGDVAIAVTDCQCRTAGKLTGNPCEKPLDDMCLFLGFWAQTALEAGAARAINKDEALKVIQRGRDAGCVHQAFTCEHTLAICNCCPCHCGPLRTFLAGVPQANLKSNFRSQLSIELCKGTCPDCIKVCPAHAITLDKKNMRPVFDSEKCIGCGQCVLACPEHAVTLRRVKEPVIYPHTWDDYLPIRAQQTGKTEFYK